MSRARSLIMTVVVTASMLPLTSGIAFADAQELWVARHDGPANGNDVAKAVATDAEGNVFVTGLEYGSPNRDDTVTRKYAPDGNLLWQRRDGTILDEHGISIAVDRNGDVFVLDIKLAVR